MSADRERDVTRLLRRLSTRDAGIVADEQGGHRLVGSDRRRGDRVSAALAEDLRAAGLLDMAADGVLRMTALGKASLRRRLAGADGFAAQHQERGNVVIADPDLGRLTVTVNHDESPLAWLRCRKGRDGQRMIGAAEFTAGERLRCDYERGQLMPRVTANWTAAVASGRRDGGSGGVCDLTEVALGARQRVERALRAVGPEFAGVLVDFCCFLKGLEEIERAQRWPARSAKVVVRMGLSCLARHYGLLATANGPDRSRGLRHWGAEDYRPTID